MKFIILGIAGLLAVVASAEKQPFERYQSIIDRQMFGPLPPGFDPTKLPSEVQKSSSTEERELTKEQEQLKSAVHFSVINVASDGATEVGFTDNSDPKMPRHYFLKVGDSRDGWTVKEADAEKATMTIVKDEIEVSLTLGGNSASGAGTTARAGAASAARPQVGINAFGGRPGGLLAGGSLRARRLQRQQEAAERQAQADAAAAEKEAAREAERQAQAEQEKAQREQEKAQREQERAEQRQQLLAIQEELKRVREAKAAAEAAKSTEGESAQNEAE